MINLAIQIDIDRHDRSVIETNSGEVLISPNWPQDCEFQLVCYRKRGRIGRVITVSQLTEDIGQALDLIERTRLVGRKKPDWLIRLQGAAAP